MIEVNLKVVSELYFIRGYIICECVLMFRFCNVLFTYKNWFFNVIVYKEI